jgi:hypothetical protein
MESKMNSTKNWNCDNDKCRQPHGETRKYPLGAGGNLILCQACFAHENQYRHIRGVQTGEPANWPQVNWNTAEVVMTSDADVSRAFHAVTGTEPTAEDRRQVNLMDALKRSIEDETE